MPILIELGEEHVSGETGGVPHHRADTIVQGDELRCDSGR